VLAVALSMLVVIAALPWSSNWFTVDRVRPVCESYPLTTSCNPPAL
jgi:hypothetical protein